jgi:hypothetical protein
MKSEMGNMKILPHSIEAEMSILGSLFLAEKDDHLLSNIFSQLKFDDLYLEKHQKIYGVAFHLYKQKYPIDLITLSEELKKQGLLDSVGGNYYLTELAESVCSIANIQNYVDIVLDKSKRCKLIMLMNKASDLQTDIRDINREVQDVFKERIIRLPSKIWIRDVLTDLNAIEDQPWWIDGLVPMQSLVMFSAPAGSYKSTLACALGSSISAGVPFGGKTTKKGKVIYVDKENSKYVLKDRLKRMFKGSEDFALWSTFTDTPPPSLTGEGFKTYLEYAKIFDVIIFDSLRKFHRFEENSSTEMEQVMTSLLKLRENGCTIIILHHRGKNELQKYRGSEEILAATDLAYSISREKDLITLDCIKNRFGLEDKKALKVIWNDTIRFEFVLDPWMKKEMEELESMEGLISQYHEKNGIWPNQSNLVREGKAVGMAKNRMPEILSKGCEKGYWMTEMGPKGAKFYKIPASQFPDTIYMQETGKVENGQAVLDAESLEEGSVPWKNHSSG